ncbi:PadR family transcriptional regulator [Staphylococcus condimenti]|uniref:PadR family transcriptional regulator n=1 Tax=Staphylococcus condimenti TaxID=70255 RepID=A0AB37GYM8_9STAP|nr:MULTISPECIES: PadR family transcriptional regulator [Staphylococcus]AMY06116.1 PadR family transcriptional regulator [Staphylococcus condimenti]APR59994.1 PadR family transcriptional regulator [Staphylococcus condimenti]MDK8646041.1 PadR family transcriptional regulator [Staphylococcus condimenti]OFP04325.1 PadR family transcriptional regulator [Staphylococcus sp. HMSC065E08]PNZ59164.1 PadR family transcriptional regulator [Staphylococcus condimenti]
MFRRGFDQFRNMRDSEGFDFGRGFGGFEKMFGGRGQERMFKKGNLQFMILNSLKEEPKHGYQIIKDLEEQFKGFYSPSPGSVYPILQMLEDREFVSVTKEGNKKIYTITEEGENFLKENADQDEFAKRMKQFQNFNREDMKTLGADIKETVNAILTTSKEAMTDEEKRKQFDRFLTQIKEQAQNLYKEDDRNDK